MSVAADQPRVLHSLPGRLRVHVPAWSGDDAERLERRLAAVRGVHRVRASPHTRNVLVEFDPQRLDHAGLTARVQRIAGGVAATASDAAPRRRQQALVTHSSARRARVAVRGLERLPELGRRLVERLEARPEVERVIPSPLTGRVLIDLAETVEDLQPILDDIAGLEPPESEEDRALPEHPLDPGPVIEGTSKLVGAALGLALLLGRRATGALTAPVTRSGPGEAAGVVNLLDTAPPVAHWIEDTLGHHQKELLFGAVAILSMTSSGSVLGLTFAAALGLRQLTEARSRQSAWREYEQRIGDAPAAHPGAVLTIAAGHRVPLQGTVLDGFGVAPTLDAEPAPLYPGATVGSGARVYGGPLTVELQGGGEFEPGGGRPPPPQTLHDRYMRVIPYAALAFAGVTALRTRSLAGALTALLVVNPRAAVAATEAADLGAKARVIRSGATVPGSRADRVISRPDVLLLGSLRTVYQGWELRAADGLGDHTADESLELAAAVSAAAGSPWGVTLPAGRVASVDGSFDGRIASAEVNGERWTLEAARDDALPDAAEAEPGDHVLVLRRQRGGELAGWLVLQPHLSRGLGVLVAVAQRHGVRLEVMSRSETPAARRLAEGAGLELVTGDIADRARALQQGGACVAVVADAVDAAAAFDAADLAIGLTSGLSGRFMARADVLAPRLEAVAAIVETGVQRDLAVRDGTVASVAANVGGALWATAVSPPFRLGSNPAMIGGLAGMLDAGVRLRGGRRARTVTERLSDPVPERWGREEVEDVLLHLRSEPNGLTGEEAQRRLRPRLDRREERGAVEMMLQQIKSPLIGVLGVGAALSVALGALGDVAMIAAVVAANAGIGAWQEGQAGAAAAALREMTAGTARVFRDGRERVLPAEQLVPGDVILLAPGSRVPADARLLDAVGLEVDESALTGESIPSLKLPDGLTAASRIVLDGTDVTTGTAKAVVVAVGEDTRMGAIAAALAEEGDRPGPLDERLGRILWKGLPLIAAGGAVVTIAGLVWRRALLSQLALGASVAIAAVPEGLPLLTGVAEAAVARRLAERRALVTRLSAIEALGRVDVACADKTGTLTTGRLALTRVADASGAGAGPDRLTPALEQVLFAAAVASPAPDAVDAQAHPTDVAVLEGARAAGLDGRLAERKTEASFDPARPYHATVANGQLYVKGAAEVVVERCTRVRTSAGEMALGAPGRAALLERAEALAAEGLRVLLVAEGPDTTDPEDPNDLTALGFVGISDPLRPAVPEAVARCRQAGVRVIMLTGDHPATAQAIAREAGLPHDEEHLLTGVDIANLDDDALHDRLERATIIARTSPLDKLRIIDVLQHGGHVVAMTGDGVNDAPALRLADVGVAMGRGGTEVARQAADLVVTDDDFSTLAEALVEGRAFWHNMRRSLGLLLGGNAGEVGLMTASAVAGLSSPLTTRQVLTVNLLTDVLPALSVAVQPPEHRNLAELSREGSAGLDAPLRADIIRRGLATALPSVAAYVTAAGVSTPEQARTVAYMSVVTTQLAQTVDLGYAEGRLTPAVVGAVTATLALVGATLWVPWLRTFLALSVPSRTGLALTGAASLAAPALGRALPIQGGAR